MLCDCRPDKLCLIFRPSLMSTGTFLFSLFANIVPSSLLFIVSHLPSLSVLSFHQNQWKSLKFHGILESDTLPVCLFPFPLLPLPGVYLLAQCLCIFDRLLCVCVCSYGSGRSGLSRRRHVIYYILMIRFIRRGCDANFEEFGVSSLCSGKIVELVGKCVSPRVCPYCVVITSLEARLSAT